MSGQDGFVPTDPAPPLNGVLLDRENIDELGIELCLTVLERLSEPGGTGE